MLEHVSGLYMKLQFEQNKLWERDENSMCFTNNFQMKNLIITKIMSHLACRVLQVVRYRYRRSGIAPPATHDTRGDLLFL